jgi:uncharacterized membrane protein
MVDVVPTDRADYESTPLSRGEYIAAIVHLYRGEQYRANTWRLRLDHTTNWAVLTTAGLLSFSFGPGTHNHWVLLLGTGLVTLFLGFEARRFRLWHVWRSRVRLIEENFYGPILRRDPVSPQQQWGEWVATDLFRPRFKISRFEAIRARLTRNYWAIYAVLLLSWAVKVVVEPKPAHTWAEIKANLDGSAGLGQEGLAGLSFLPWWAPLVYVAGILLAIALLLALTPRTPSSAQEYWNVDGEEGRAPGAMIDL